jgi:hypothetical protein
MLHLLAALLPTVLSALRSRRDLLLENLALRLPPLPVDDALPARFTFEPLCLHGFARPGTHGT